ncbi:MAG TPA: hypothetical protein VF297_10610 [Pyrinomonadaceae bacterium]
MNNDIYGLARLVVIGIGIVIASFTIIGAIAFWRTKQGAAEIFSRLFERSDAIRVLTVGGIVIAATFLALVGIIKESAVVAILSGIAGYVLGGTQRSKVGERGGQKTNGKSRSEDEDTFPADEK